MMRSANAMESESCDPPNPRLITCLSGKHCARLVQNRMLELPTNRIAPCGGGLVLSLASNALISFSHLRESSAAAAGWVVVRGVEHPSATSTIKNPNELKTRAMEED